LAQCGENLGRLALYGNLKKRSTEAFNPTFIKYKIMAFNSFEKLNIISIFIDLCRNREGGVIPISYY
jgi:hypothetical protein